MTTLSIQPPFPLITDIDGQPLEDGYIWIGVANLPPIGNPVSVYWDAALTQPAALPVRTRGGYPVNNGTPARLYVGSDYSIQVQNKNGSVIYSAPAATERYSGVVVEISSTDVSFLQAGTGAVTRTAQAKMRDIISAADFGVVGDNVTDNSVALQNFLNACRNSLGYIPPGDYKYSTTLTLNTAYGTRIEGAVWQNTNPVSGGSRLIYTGTGNAITISGAGSVDKEIRLSHLTIEGNASSQHGVSVTQAHIHFDNLWITNNGGHGILMDRAWSSEFHQCFITQNYQHGVLVNFAGNAILFSHCAFNGNARTNGGYGGCALTGSASLENLGVTFVSCDFTGNGYPAGVTQGYGISIQHTWGIALIGCYAEQNKTRNLYADSTVRNLTVQNCYWQDGVNEIADVFGLVYENNIHQQVSSTTQANISGSTSARRLNRVFGNTVTGGATQTYSAGVKQISEVYANAIPTTGTWEIGDIVWYASPDYGLPIGWVCVAAGTPGTWRPIVDRIPGTFADWGDSNTTLNPIGSLGTNIWASPLSANRTVTLSTTNAFSGCKFRITRRASSTGAFNLNVGSGPLKALATGQWCDVEYDGAAWQLVASGSL